MKRCTDNSFVFFLQWPHCVAQSRPLILAWISIFCFFSTPLLLTHSLIVLTGINPGRKAQLEHRDISASLQKVGRVNRLPFPQACLCFVLCNADWMFIACNPPPCPTVLHRRLSRTWEGARVSATGARNWMSSANFCLTQRRYVTWLCVKWMSHPTSFLPCLHRLEGGLNCLCCQGSSG